LRTKEDDPTDKDRGGESVSDFREERGFEKGQRGKDMRRKGRTNRFSHIASESTEVKSIQGYGDVGLLAPSKVFGRKKEIRSSGQRRSENRRGGRGRTLEERELCTHEGFESWQL